MSFILNSPATQRVLQGLSNWDMGSYLSSPLSSNFPSSFDIGNFTPQTIDYGNAFANAYNQQRLASPIISDNLGSDSSWFDSWDWGSIGDIFKNADGSWNWQGIGQGLAGLGNLGNAVGGLYTAYNANNLAKKQFNFQKDLANINLNNNIREYNTKLGDIARTRSIMETGSDGAYADWYEQNKATRQV